MEKLTLKLWMEEPIKLWQSFAVWFGLCTACWEDVKNGNEITEQMILMVAKALKDVKVDIENEKTVF